MDVVTLKIHIKNKLDMPWTWYNI